MKSWLYKWLPIIFGCHCLKERSFYYKGRKFPICARCTGELMGIFIGALVYIIFKPNWKVSCMLLIPMMLDGFIQALTTYESNNFKRFVTGFIFGCGMMCLFLMSIIMAFQFGYEIGNSMFARF